MNFLSMYLAIPFRFALALFCLSIYFGDVYADNSELDSLKNVLIHAEDDTNKIDLLCKISKKHRDSSPDKALRYVQQAMILSGKLDFLPGLAKSKNYIGVVNLIQGNYETAISSHLLALQIYEQLERKAGIASSMVNLGVVYYYLDNLYKANDYFLKSLKINEEIGDQDEIAGCLNNIAVIFKEMGNYTDALNYYHNSLEMSEKMGNRDGIAMSLNNIGSVYEQLQQPEKAIDYYKRSLKIKEELGNKIGMTTSLYNIAEIYIQEGKWHEANKFLEKCLGLALGLNSHDMIMDVYKSYAAFYSKQKKYEKAFEYQSRYSSLKDSLRSGESTRQIAEMETKYKTEQKEKEIDLLNMVNNLNKLDIINKESKVKSQQAVIFISIGTIALVLILVFLIHNRYRLKRKALALLNTKNRQITDSINYAKRIQLAILPPKSVLEEHLKGSFILYKPKDIVSGDFYWVGRNNGSTLFATVDCTGHGIPGAFMSMIGNTLLNQIVHENRITKPSEILEELHERVVTALNQGAKEDYSRDGMDIAICNWNIKANTLEYAGAHIPLYHIRNGKLKEIKGDRFFIGGPELKANFNNHSLALEKGDTIYIFSDGYADQKGGPKNKKFFYKPFKKMLLDIQGKSMEDQKTHLDQTISNWMENHDQIDDILIVGVKV